MLKNDHKHKRDHNEHVDFDGGVMESFKNGALRLGQIYGVVQHSPIALCTKFIQLVHLTIDDFLNKTMNGTVNTYKN